MNNGIIHIRAGEKIKKKAGKQAKEKGETMTAYIKRLILEDGKRNTGIS